MAKNYEIDPQLKFFRTRYRFGSRAEKDRFFDDLVINNIYSYPRIFRDWFLEKLEIMRSYKILMFAVSGIAFIIAALALLNGNWSAAVANLLLSLLMLAGALITGKRIFLSARDLAMTEDLNASEGFLELMRESRIEWLREDHPERLMAAGYHEGKES